MEPVTCIFSAEGNVDSSPAVCVECFQVEL
jgi:hypothetical protein